ncbi:MAG: hypothetical protein WCE30_25830 [Mycobacterium sp.]
MKYADPKAAIQFLLEAFGQNALVVEGMDDIVEHAQLRVGNGLIFLSADRGDDRYGMHSPLTLHGSSHALCVWVADNALNDHQARAEAAGAQILNPVHESLAGVHECTCTDQENQVWTFGSYRGE